MFGPLDLGGWSLDLGALSLEESAITENAMRSALGADRRTPAAQVPDTELGRAYLKLPQVTAAIADAMKRATAEVDYTDGNGINLRDAAFAHFAAILPRLVANYSFAEFAADPISVIERIVKAPLFAWDNNEAPATFRYDPFGEIPFPMQRAGNRFRMPPLYGPFLLYQWSLRTPGIIVDINDPGFTNFKGAGRTWFYSPLEGFTFSEGIIASQWYENSSFGIRPPAWWPKVWRDYFWTVEEKRAELVKAETKARILTAVGAFLALVSLGSALTAIAAQGMTIVNGVKLVSAIDRLPGVDLGGASEVITWASRIVSLDLFQTGAIDSAQQAGSTAADTAAQGANVDSFGVSFDAGNFDFQSPMFSTFDGGGFSSFDTPSVFNFNDAFTVGSTWADFGNITDSIGDVIPFDTSLADASSNWLGNFDLSKFVLDVGKLYTQYRLAEKAMESAGSRPPQQVTRPTPGTSRQLPDGSVMRVNQDGSTTITAPSGQSQTVTTDGRIVSGASGGISTQTLLIAGGVGLAAILLLRK